MKEDAGAAYQWDRVATGRRHASLHMDVRFLAGPTDTQHSHPPSRGKSQSQSCPEIAHFVSLENHRSMSKHLSAIFLFSASAIVLADATPKLEEVEVTGR
jgi:hypothetical protein